MDIKVLAQPAAADTLLIFAGQSHTVLTGIVDTLTAQGDFSGKAGEVVILYPAGDFKRVVLVGLDDTSAEDVRRAAALGASKARKSNAKNLAIVSAGLPVQSVVEGALMGLYTYNGQKTQNRDEAAVESLQVLIADESELASAKAEAARGQAYAEGAILARDLVNLPPNICTPSYLAEQALKMAAANNLKADALKENQIRALRMGALLAVAQGSHERPRFIIMEHNAGTDYPTVVLVGKGVTFDTGGYTLKTRDGMIGMKADMGGGAAVIGAMQIIAQLDVPLHVVGLVPTSDNNISEKAYRPQEVITASNGKTIEVISTDAEGRMLLADALVYAKRYKPSAVVDIATLTGSCVVALGNAAAGFFSIDDALRDQLITAGESTGERVWQLPLYPEYFKAIKSDTADMMNVGGRTKGVGTAAAFLRNFVDYPVWAHVDMAGMMLDAEDNPTIPTKGGTGYGARLLAQFVENWVGVQ